MPTNHDRNVDPAGPPTVDTPAQAQFKDKLLKLLDWVSERDPMAAARLVGEWSEDVARELTCGCEEPCGTC